jgi:hypothetical protein
MWSSKAEFIGCKKMGAADVADLKSRGIDIAPVSLRFKKVLILLCVW